VNRATPREIPEGNNFTYWYYNWIFIDKLRKDYLPDPSLLGYAP
jgi:hypothetical protein